MASYGHNVSAARQQQPEFQMTFLSDLVTPNAARGKGIYFTTLSLDFLQQRLFHDILRLS